jgi:DNA-binding SARP family transcriptional activator
LRISINDTPVGRCVSSRARSVFAYLVVNRDAPVPRDVLMEQFWCDSDPKDARNSLNVALHSLRRACKSAGDLPIVHYDDGAYRLNTDLDLWTDVDDFLNLNERGRKFEATNKIDAAIEAYEQALALYQGDFLSDCPYEDWAAMLREKLRLLYLETLDRLSVIYLQREQFATCITLCQLILARDNCREDAHCRLMRCYARQNQHPLALRQYQACVEALQKELDVPPDEKTTALHERIRKREWV